MSKKYTKPRIFHGGATFDLKKRWYVYYSYLDPESGKMKRQTPVTLKVNRRFKTKKERLTHLEFIRKALEEVLKEGFNPYEKELAISTYSCEEALDYALSLKKQPIGKTYRDYESKVNALKAYLNEI